MLIILQIERDEKKKRLTSTLCSIRRFLLRNSTKRRETDVYCSLLTCAYYLFFSEDNRTADYVPQGNLKVRNALEWPRKHMMM